MSFLAPHLPVTFLPEDLPSYWGLPEQKGAQDLHIGSKEQPLFPCKLRQHSSVGWMNAERGSRNVLYSCPWISQIQVLLFVHLGNSFIVRSIWILQKRNNNMKKCCVQWRAFPRGKFSLSSFSIAAVAKCWNSKSRGTQMPPNSKESWEADLAIHKYSSACMASSGYIVLTHGYIVLMHGILFE